jgi:hypothetical protein
MVSGPNPNRRDKKIFCSYKADRARRTLRGIDEQVKKAEKAVAGQAPVSVNLREDMIIGDVDQWLAREFAPHRLTGTLRDLVAAQR